MTTEIAPETVNGWVMLHQYFTVDWREAAAPLAQLEKFLNEWHSPRDEGQSALFYVYGHKASVLLIHFRKDFELLAAAQQKVEKLLPIGTFKPTYSFLSVVELGLYHATVTTRKKLEGEGLQPNSEEWNAKYNEAMEKQYSSQYVIKRQFCVIPERRYVSFYPMNKKRGEKENWYTEPLVRRAEMMMEHGENGRRFAGSVEQVISGSIGLDEWEWGVDLFVDDPLVAKQLVYEMRFDEGSARFAEFGDFLFARRIFAPEVRGFITEMTQQE